MLLLLSIKWLTLSVSNLDLKRLCHEIFCFRLYFTNHLPPGPWLYFLRSFRILRSKRWRGGGVEGCKGINIYCIVPECLSGRLNWIPPAPPMQASVASPQDTRMQGRGWGYPFQTKGQTLFYSTVYSNPFTGFVYQWVLPSRQFRDQKSLGPHWKTARNCRLCVLPRIKKLPPAF